MAEPGWGNRPIIHVAVTYFQTGSLDLLTDGILALVGGSYVLSLIRLRRAGRRTSPGRTGALFAGLALVFVALGSGLAAYDDRNVSAHVAQHLILMMLAPPFLVLGRPLALWCQASPRRCNLASPARRGVPPFEFSPVPWAGSFSTPRWSPTS